MDFGDFMSAAPSSSEVELDRKLYTMLEIEAKRYQNFFATLDEHQSGLLPRDVVLAFYGKSSLTEQEITEMYQLIKSLQLVADPHAMNETEFITGMHFIVCMTKRSLAKLPSTFPKYLFPTLDLTPSSSVSHASYGISSMPSPDKEDLMLGGGGGSAFATSITGNNSVSGMSSMCASVSQPVATGEIEKLQDAKSLQQLLEKEIRNKRLEARVLVKVDQSESNALQSLHGCLHLIAENVERLGYFVPATARALDALDDFSNLLRSHVQTTKQEIQSLEISAQMLSVTSESSNNGGLDKQRDDPFKEIAKLTQELTALQQQAAQLYQRKETLLQQVNEKKLKGSQPSPSPAPPTPVQQQQQQAFPTKSLDSSFDSSSATTAMGGASVGGTTHIGVLSPTPSSGSASAGWGDFGATGTPSSSSQQEVRHSESVESNPFEFGAAPFSAPAASVVANDPVASSGAASNDFSWGDFSQCNPHNEAAASIFFHTLLGASRDSFAAKRAPETQLPSPSLLPTAPATDVELAQGFLHLHPPSFLRAKGAVSAAWRPGGRKGKEGKRARYYELEGVPNAPFIRENALEDLPSTFFGLFIFKHDSMGGAQSTETTPATKVFSRELPDTRTATRGPIHVVDGERDYEPSMTLYTNLHARKAVDDGSRNFLGTRAIDPVTGKAGAYEWVTYGAFLTHVEAVSSGMRRALGLKRHDVVGLFSKNRYEWSLVEHSGNRMAYTLVPLYDTLGLTAVPFIINHTEMRVVFCAKAQFKTLMECVHECVTLEIVVQYEDVDESERALAKEKNVTLLTLAEVQAVGEQHPEEADPPLPEDVCTICYTSGTTGEPKGAILTHANMMFAIKAVGDFAALYPTDVHLSYLPLAHIYERNVQTNLISHGGALGYYQGDATKLMDDMAELKPTIFPTVPRILNRIFDKVTQGVAAAGGVKKFLFDQAYAAKKHGLENGGYLTHGLWDSLVFNKLKLLIGGNVRLMMNASAPLSHEVKEFIQIAFGCHVLEGYGLTETAAGLTCSNPFVPIGNHVGIPLPGLEVRLEDVPDMNYTSNDTPLPRGEVLVRGRNVFKGYYKQPELTAEVLSEDGWFHTGDVGAWNENGTLRIIDRKKNIFKLSQGEYVAPEKIEDVYLKSPFVAQIYVHGDSLQNYLVGVVVPDQDVVVRWAQEQGKTADQVDPEELKKVIAANMEELALSYKLFRFERVQRLHVHTTSVFAVENDLLTPTFKPRRKNLSTYFAKEIDEMYAQHAAAF